MASAKFLEEALSTDVDESAVSALVGSLETQLVTTTPAVSTQQGPSTAINQNHMNSAIANGGTVSSQKHGVTNGSSGSMNIILNSETNKPVTTSSLQSSSVVHSNVNTVVASLHGGVPASGYINQVTSSASQSNVTNITKSHEAVKIVYPSSSQTLATSGGVNLNSRVAFPPGALPNGNLGLAPLSSHAVLNTVTSSVQSVVSQTHTQSASNIPKQIGGVIGIEHGKTPGTALVIKTSNPNVTQGTQLGANVVSVPMTVNTTMTLSGTHVNTVAGTTSSAAGMTGVVTLTKPITHTVGTPQAIVGNPSTLLPANVQIVNVNPVRPGTPGQAGQKGMPPRVVIGPPQMVGGRPGQPGQITLQTLQGLQPGTQGHLLLKTENGQYQLLRVGPAPTTPGAAIAPNSAATTLPAGATYRLQSLPAQSTVTVATTTAGSGVIQATQPPALVTQTATVQRHPVDTTKEKCRKFLANLLELSSREPKSVERNVRTLIQELIDTKVEPEEFCDRLERLLNASPQPCLIGFLKKSLPLLRQSLATKELVIEGIRPPANTVVYSLPNSATVVPQLQTQLRQPTPAAQVRLMTPVNASTQSVGVTTVPRPVQTMQHRVVTPVRATTPAARMVTAAHLRPHSPISTSAPTPPNSAPQPVKVTTSSLTTPPLHIRPQQQHQIQQQQLQHSQASPQTIKVQTSLHMKPPTPVHIKTSISNQPKITMPSHPKPPVPSLLPKPTVKEKEKKSFSSAGYTGDDDINDVAAMGGVNLAEETQRILGSTEFVGTQIRSCKDEIFLHALPLQHKIRQIVAQHGLEEPSPEVAALISHATQERLKNLVEKLAVIAEHRIDVIKVNPRYEVTQDVRGQLKFLEELDRMERKRHEEQERELLLRAAKSRSKSEDPEQAKLKAKAKEMQRAEMEELRQREANLTALQAIGPRKKPKLEIGGAAGSSGQTGVSGANGAANALNRAQLPIRPRLKRVNLRDLLFLLEQEKETCRTPLLYKAFLK